jgi:nitrite reductase (NADH) large subunit
MREKLLIVGNGMASVRLLECLLRHAPQRFTVTVVGAERTEGYNRVLLSALLAQDVDQTDVILKDRQWYAQNGISLISADRVVAIDAAARKATLVSGLSIGFDHCVFATGSHPIRLPIPGMDKPGVITFRDLADVNTLERAAIHSQRVAVIGGGLLGIEAAYGLAKRGADVTLVHVMDRLMERQLDNASANLVKNALVSRKVKVMLLQQTCSVSGEGSADGLLFADGTRLDADLVVCAVGIRPNTDLAKLAGLAVNRGIVVDDAMQTSVERFHAIGECAEHRGIAYGLVEPAYAQADVLARSLAGQIAAFDGMVLATNLKVSGLPVFSAGSFMDDPARQSAVLTDRNTGTYRKLVFEGDKLVGCVLVGETDDALWYLDLIRCGTDVAAARSLLIHGRDFAVSLLGAKPEANPPFVLAA